MVVNAPATEPPARPTRWWLPALLVTSLALPLYVASMFTIRPDYGPDEPQHVERIHIMARERRMPTADDIHTVPC